MIQIVTRGAYLDLMDAGVKIYEYTPGFVHSKQVLADDEMAVVVGRLTLITAVWSITMKMLSGCIGRLL